MVTRNEIIQARRSILEQYRALAARATVHRINNTARCEPDPMGIYKSSPIESKHSLDNEKDNLLENRRQ